MKTSKKRSIANRGFLISIALALLLALFVMSPVWSLTSRVGEQVTIAATETIDDDLYIAGNTITIDGTVKGDAVLAGGSIAINGRVEGDVIAAGRAIVINGSVGDDVRMAGQALILDAKARVGDDAIAAGLSLETKAGSTVGGDLNFAGERSLLAGNVKQDVIGATNSLQLGGVVGGNMEVTAFGDPDLVQLPPFIAQPPVNLPEVQPGLTLTDTARVSGKLNYKSIATANISPKAQIAGGVVAERLEHREAQPSSPVWPILWQLQRLLALVLVAWLLLRFAPAWTQNLAATVQAKPLPSLGWGIATFIGVGVLAVAIALVTFILAALFTFTLPSLIPPVLGLGLLAMLALAIGFLVIAGYVPQIVLSFLGGRWLLQKLRPDEPSGRFAAAIVGLVGFVILTAIPVLGGIFSLAIVLLGLGAIWLWGKTKFDRRASDRQLTAV
jgi:cytoskeletal protein CcmA (bactofilin family)